MLTDYICKTIQIVLFLGLLCLIVYRRCKGTSHIGKLTIVITILALINGFASIARVHSIFHIFTTQEHDLTFQITYCIECITFFGVLWFFCIKYYETASDLEQMLDLKKS